MAYLWCTALTDCEDRLAHVTDDGWSVVVASVAWPLQAAVAGLPSWAAADAAEMLVWSVVVGAVTAQPAGEQTGQSLADDAVCDSHQQACYHPRHQIHRSQMQAASKHQTQTTIVLTTSYATASLCSGAEC